MKERYKTIIALLMIFTLAALMCACGGDKDSGGDTGSEAAAAEAAASDDQTEAEDTESGSEEDGETIVKSFTEIDTEDMNDLPLEMESVNLYEDGSVEIVPLDDLKRNAESNNELKKGVMRPFDEFGKVKDIYLVRFGNGGYRTVIALMEDGTLAAMSAKELIQDHIIVVMPNMTGRDNYVSVKQISDSDAFGVVGETEDGQEIELDYSLNF